MHIHVRDPQTGRGSREVALYREVVERIRASDVDPVLNLTCGMGGDLVLGDVESPLDFDRDATDMAGAADRLAHVEELRPEICTLDCGTMNFAAGGDYIMVNSPSMLRAMARRVRELGVRPELEVFDTGQLVFVHELVRDGLIDEPPLIQLCMGIPYGAPDDIGTLLALINRLPAGAVFSTFAIGRMQLAYAALAPIVGANVRVGLEDNLYLSRGQLATNAELVERAVALLDAHHRPRTLLRRGARPARAGAPCVTVPDRSACSAVASSAAAGPPASCSTASTFASSIPIRPPPSGSTRCWATRAAPTGA